MKKKGITVLVDGVVFENTYQIGIWRLFFEVMQRNASNVDYVLLYETKLSQPVPHGVKLLRSWHRADSRSWRKPLTKLRKHLALRVLEHNYRHAIWHSTFYTVDPRRHGTSVVSVYDMIAERFFYLQAGFAHQARQKRLCFDSGSVFIPISDSTARDFAKFFPSKQDRVLTALLGGDHLSHRAACVEPSNSPYCLFVGARGGYKNFQLLIAALRSEFWPRELCVKVVGAPFNEDEKRLLDYEGVKHVFENQGVVDDLTLSHLYAGAVCFVFPSLCEGFGLPILESQRCGTIPVVSDIDAFHEVAGSAGIYFDPRCPKSLAQSVKAVFEQRLAAKMLPEALRNVDSFRWDWTAKKTLEAYEIAANLPLAYT